jgi:hypothetical protein
MNNKEVREHVQKYLDVVNNLYPEITKEFESIETEGEFHKGDARITDFENKIDRVLKTLKQVDLEKIAEIVDEENLQKTEHNINFITEDLLYIKKRLLAYEYANDLEIPIKNYIKSMALDPSFYKKWAKYPEELTNKFIAMLIHPDNIEVYKSQIKKLISGSMSQKEFNKFFDSIKYKMISLPKFQSFQDYKGEKQVPRQIKYKP